MKPLSFFTFVNNEAKITNNQVKMTIFVRRFNKY